jgi:hypothetical protein
MMSKQSSSQEDEVPLPGFRFHPTDEELVAFYLRRKVEKKPISFDLIKQIDIYKHDPWDLPSMDYFTFSLLIISSLCFSLINMYIYIYIYIYIYRYISIACGFFYRKRYRYI